MVSKTLSAKIKAGYGICDLGGNLFFTAMGFWALNYLTDTVAIPAAAAGFAIMIGKIWDAISDPMMGYISDRTKTRIGRRRPFILVGSIPLGLAMWYFFSNPNINSSQQATIWAIVTLCFLNSAFTVVNIPYSALAPELTKDYNEKTSLMTYRFMFAMIGTIFGAVIVLIILGFIPNRNTGFSFSGLIMGSIMTVTALITFFSVKEKNHDETILPTDNPIKTYKEVFKNKAFVLLIVTYALNMIAINYLQGILVYYFKYIYNDESKTMIAMVCLLLVAIIVIPFAGILSKKIGKKKTYQIGFAIIATSCSILFFLGHILGPTFFFAIMILAGIGLGIALVAPWAMVPDTIEWDAKHTGTRKEGAYYGMWTFISKLGQAVAVGSTGLILSASGYIAEIQQTATTQRIIRVIIGPLPAFVFIAAIIVISFYPLSEKAYTEMIKAEE